MESEIWKDINGFEGCYQVSNTGKVRSLDREVKCNKGTTIAVGRILNQYVHHRGYFKVRLMKSNKGKNFSVHRLVCDAFIPNPENKPHVNHINGVKSDNIISNLEWCTHSENMQHAWDTGLSKITESRIAGSKKNRSSSSVICENGVVFKSIKDAALHFGVSAGYMSHMLSGHRVNKFNLKYI